jgi:glutathione S-transferase
METARRVVGRPAARHAVRLKQSPVRGSSPLILSASNWNWTEAATFQYVRPVILWGTAVTYTLYSMQSSGNCYKPRLLMHMLGIDFKLIETDAGTGITRKPEFLALNPNGRVPLLILPDGRRLSESDAMLLYLAEGTRFLPADRYERAVACQWLFFEQYEHEPTIAVARSWLVADACSVADLALYAYTHVADEGDFDLTPYPGIRAWLDRVAAQPGYISMDWGPSDRS